MPLNPITIKGDQVVSNVYSNDTLAGVDILLYYNGFKFLSKNVDFTVRSSGGFTLIGTYAGITLTSLDEFIIIPSFISNNTSNQFTASVQVQQNTSGQAIITDISDYSIQSKNLFTNRQIFLYRHDGTLLNSNTNFNFSNYTSDVIAIQLFRDYAIMVKMVLTPISPIVGSLYVASTLKSFDYYANEYAVAICYNIANNPSLKSSPNYYNGMQKIFVNLKASAIAVSAYKQREAQFALDQIKQIADNPILLY